MSSSFRNRFGIPGVISVIALVFAMFGGAYAANDSSSGDATASAQKNNKAKQGKPGKPGKQGKPGPAGPAGPAGATGPAGPAGPAGDKGDAGSNGANGSNGTNGTSPVGTAFAGNQKGCAEGGVEFKGANTTVACNGIKGSPWTVGGTLPEGEMLTGAWSIWMPVGAAAAEVGPPAGFDNVFAPISFPIPLESGLAGSNVHYINTAGKEVVLGEEFDPTGCGSDIGPGVNAANPQASPGHLCVYAAKAEGMGDFLGPSINNPAANPFQSGSSTVGAVLTFISPQKTLSARGTWAVAAPE